MLIGDHPSEHTAQVPEVNTLGSTTLLYVPPLGSPGRKGYRRKNMMMNFMYLF